MSIIKNVILLPLLPLRLAWKWSSGAAMNGQPNGCAHLIGCLIIAGIMYGLIGWGIMALVNMFGK